MGETGFIRIIYPYPIVRRGQKGKSNLVPAIGNKNTYRQPCGMVFFPLCSSSPAAFAIFEIIRFSPRRPFLEPGIIIWRASLSCSMSTMEGKEKKTLVPIEQSERKSCVSQPTPPEKPLPGDCCGSGCVRCVWDLYYEELEEYNSLLSNIDTSVEQTTETNCKSN